MPHQLKPACLRPFCDAWKVTVGRGAWKLSRIQEENIVQIFLKAAFWGCRITLGLPAGDFEFSSGRIESRLHSQVYKNNRNCRSFAHEIPAILCAWRYMSAREHPLSNQQFSQQRLSRQTPLNLSSELVLRPLNDRYRQNRARQKSCPTVRSLRRIRTKHRAYSPWTMPDAAQANGPGLVDFPVGRADFNGHLPNGEAWLKLFMTCSTVDWPLG